MSKINSGRIPMTVNLLGKNLKINKKRLTAMKRVLNLKSKIKVKGI
jgi:hypothetical protein